MHRLGSGLGEIAAVRLCAAQMYARYALRRSTSILVSLHLIFCIFLCRCSGVSVSMQTPLPFHGCAFWPGEIAAVRLCAAQMYARYLADEQIANPLDFLPDTARRRIHEKEGVERNCILYSISAHL